MGVYKYFSGGKTFSEPEKSLSKCFSGAGEVFIQCIHFSGTVEAGEVFIYTAIFYLFYISSQKSEPRVRKIALSRDPKLAIALVC